MNSPVLIDTGPLTALLNPNDRFHAWARRISVGFPRPLLTCEAVLTESAFLLRRGGCDADELFQLMDDGFIAIGIQVVEERVRLRELMHRYRNLPMSLADATLVRLSELHRDCRVWTLDSDFRIYRRHRSKAIPLLMPEE